MIRRLKQTYRHLAAEPDEAIAQHVPPRYRAIVDALSRPDRRHALSTYAKLRAAGAAEDLCLVGLLHDLGKPQGARLWHRVAAVLAPELARRMGGATTRAYLDHAAAGARRARELGLGERVARLIERHHLPPRTDDERALALADRE